MEQTKNKSKLKNSTEKQLIKDIMKLSESSFSEWDNEEDEVYNKGKP